MKTVNETVINLKKVSCKLGHQFLLKNIDWEVKKGEHWVVFGMNGSGKTTLLSVIAGVRKYTQGSVELFSENLSAENIINFRKKIGLVSTSFFEKHYSKESALNIVLSGRTGMLGLDYNLDLNNVRMAKELLTELKLGNKMDRTFDMFSKGERQNILIARALIGKPEILILDEPCTGLDIYSRSYLFRTIEELSEKTEMAIIYVTHYVEEILPVFERTLLLKNGLVYAQGETIELFSQTNMNDFFDYPVKIMQDAGGTYHVSIEAISNLLSLLE